MAFEALLKNVVVKIPRCAEREKNAWWRSEDDRRRKGSKRYSFLIFKRERQKQQTKNGSGGEWREEIVLFGEYCFNMGLSL